MDLTDKKLLNVMQKGLPICEFPFDKISKELGISTQEVINRIEVLKANGFIRRIGAVFNTKRMGYKSVLIAMAVPKEKVYETAEIINCYAGVTHNYHRENSINIWFTLSAKNEEEKRFIINEIKEKTGEDKLFELPAEKHFKQEVFFDMERVEND